ncbi:MAG: hypothetical protein ACMG57_01470, partial [Candidatus Dojkabacteria bacterium]
MLFQPIETEAQENNYLEVGTPIIIENILHLDSNHKFLLNATGYSPDILITSLMNCLLNEGGNHFFTESFKTNAWMAMRMTTVQ